MFKNLITKWLNTHKSTDSGCVYTWHMYRQLQLHNFAIHLSEWVVNVSNEDMEQINSSILPQSIL